MTDKPLATKEEKIIPRKKRWFVSPIKSVLATDNQEAKLSIKKLEK